MENDSYIFVDYFVYTCKMDHTDVEMKDLLMLSKRKRESLILDSSH